MERDGEATTTFSSSEVVEQHKGGGGGGEEEERGGGGKLRKAFVPKHRPLPYARPSKKDGDGSWWRSMVVSPASRLIVGGASRILPSFFSNAAAEQPTPHTRAADVEVNQDATDQGLEMMVHDIQTKSSVEGGQVPLEAEVTKCGSYMDLPAANTLQRPSAGTGISEIEQMLKGKTLSRDDLNRLTEILHSRVPVPSDVDECKTRNLGATTGADSVIASLNQEILEGPDDKSVYQSRFREENPYPLATSQDLLAASPVDIAKAYMGTRTTEYGVGSQSAILKEETTPLPASVYFSKPFATSPTPRSSICWPGAKVQPSHSYLTPQTERHTVGLLTFPQTPISRAIHSRSTSKLEGVGDRSRNIMTINSKQSQTPVYGGSQVTGPSILSHNDGFGSVGPIHRARRKFRGTPIPPKGMSSSRPTYGGFWNERFDATTDLLPKVKQNQDSGTSTSSSTKFQHVDVKGPSSVGPSFGHPQSSDMARRILEHLDRTLPTPEKKSAELKLATSWRKTISSESTSTGKAPVSNTPMECSENSNIMGHQLFDQEKEVRGTSLLNDLHEKRKQNEATNAIDVPLNTKLSTNEVSNRHGERAQSDKKQLLPPQSEVGGQALSRFTRRDAGNEAPNVPKKLSTHTFGKKPPLTSISITRPDPKNRVSFDNGSGFTFPVSLCSGSLFEPPTPSIMPSFSETSLPQTQEDRTNPSDNSRLKGVPSYSFGSQTVGRSLVFSFPSSSSSVQSDLSTPNFTFGSDMARISFRSVNEDAVCS